MSKTDSVSNRVYLLTNYKLLRERKKHDIYAKYTYRYITLYTFENVQKGIQGLHAWAKITANQ